MFESKLIGRIKERKREIADALADHPVEDYAKYQRQVGLHQGLNEVLDMINELLNDNTEL